MSSNIQTDKLAPRIIINENEINPNAIRSMNAPVTLMFGFAPIGKTNEMVVCNTISDIHLEFGKPTSAPEKYFIDSALRLVQNGATALMTRLPYDNFQCHEVKFVDYRLEQPIAMKDIATGPMETNVRERDDNSVSILKELNNIDPLMNQVQRISQVSSSTGLHIGHMSNEQFNQMQIEPKEFLNRNTFRIVDIIGDQYGVGASQKQYAGIFPIVTTAPMALYYHNKIKNSIELDKAFKLIDIDFGIEMSTRWYREARTIDDYFKEEQAKILTTIKQELNFDTKRNRFHRMDSFQDECVSMFPLINEIEMNKLERTNTKNIGILVCKLTWNEDSQQTELSILESFVGSLGNNKNSIDRKINSSSRFIRMYKNLQIPVETDCFVIDNQKITSIGMEQDECVKNINYKTSIIDPITHCLEHIYSDVDSLQLDVILDAGLSSTAFAAYITKNQNGVSFKDDNDTTIQVNWFANEYNPEDDIQDYAFVWNHLTKMFGDFIKNVRGDCVYIADGPRITNLERNYPISNYTTLDNIQMFNKFLPYFNGYTNNYVARYWNWVYMEDMQYENAGIWVPGSVVMGSQLAFNDSRGQVWYAPAGQNRGLISETYDISVKTKQYNQENDILYQNNWNFFNIYQNEGVVVEGQKTMQTKKTSLDRLNVRRLVCYIKQQARLISNRYKYEPHTDSMRDAFKNELISMLKQIQRTSGISEFKILCDKSNNTIETIDRHELHCMIGIKPIKALEYIIIDLNILNGTVSMDDTKIVKEK